MAGAHQEAFLIWQVLMHSHGTLRHAGEGLESSKRVLRQMARRAAANKLALWLVIGVILLLIFFLLWSGGEGGATAAGAGPPGGARGGDDPDVVRAGGGAWRRHEG